MGRQVEIGSLRERVEILEEPGEGPCGRTGRIRHANGENATIDSLTLLWLIERAKGSEATHAEHGQRDSEKVLGQLWA